MILLPYGRWWFHWIIENERELVNLIFNFYLNIVEKNLEISPENKFGNLGDDAESVKSAIKQHEYYFSVLETKTMFPNQEMKF